MNTLKRVLVTGLMAAALLTNSFGSMVQSVHATQTDSNTTGAQKRADLIANGYTCVVVSVGNYECTKKDDTTYWCDGLGNCQPAPRKNTDATADAGQVTDAPLSVEPGTPQVGPGKVKTTPRISGGR